MNKIQFVNSTTNIKVAEFISINVTPINTSVNTASVVTLNISTSYRNETCTVDLTTGTTALTFEAVSGLLNVGEYHRDLQSSSNDTSISLDGVSQTQIQNGALSGIGLVLNYNIKGSPLTIWRGFYDDSGNLMTYTDGQGRTRRLIQRFYGVVTSFTITENSDPQNLYYSIVLNCSSIKTILSNNVVGRRTNHDDFQHQTLGYMYQDGMGNWQLSATKTGDNSDYDTSMDQVAPLNNAYFNFGQKP